MKNSNDKRIVLKDYKCKYVISAGYGKYGKSIIVVVFENDSDVRFWRTEVNAGSLKDFTEGEIYNISIPENYKDSKYINYVKIV